MITDLDLRRRAHAAEEDAAAARRLIVQMLEDRWDGMGKWADSLACEFAGHPKRPTGEGVCCCGHVIHPNPEPTG